ncbi:MAG TPA: hypothetical protein VJK53_02455 [Candidatus Paceibacterota bacterium]
MSKRTAFIIAGLFLVIFLILAGTKQTQPKDAQVAALAQTSLSASAVSFGTLTPFYRFTQLQGPYFRPDGASFLVTIPSYLSGNALDFPYKRKNAEGVEVPFVDGFTVARVLGGYGGYTTGNGAEDIIDYDPATGKSTTHYDWVTDALQPYLDAGYKPSDITLGLDNIPWDIATNACSGGISVSGPYGNRSPVGDSAVWGTLITDFADYLNAFTGGKVADFRYKLGIEWNDSESFCGTEAEYKQYYALTHDALKKVVSSPQMMPFEFAGSHDQVIGTVTLNTMNVYRDLLDADRPLAGVARSVQTFQTNGKDPSGTADKAQEAISSLNDFTTAYPSLTNHEIHQLGLFPDFDIAYVDNSTRGASWNFQMLFRMRAKDPKLSTAAHWDLFDTVPETNTTEPYLIPTAASLLYQIFDNQIGSHMYELPAATGADDPNTETYAVGFKSSGRTVIIVSNYMADTKLPGAGENISITIPASALPPGSAYALHSLSITDELTPVAALAQIIREGKVPHVRLKEPYASDRTIIAPITQMITGDDDAGAYYLREALATNTLLRRFIELKTVLLLKLKQPTASESVTKNPDGSYTLTAGILSPTHIKVFELTPLSTVITASPTTLTAGTPITVSWSNISSPTPTDWIGLYSANDTTYTSGYIAWRYVNCTKAPSIAFPFGTCVFPIPATVKPGTYKFVLLGNNRYKPLGESSPVTVTAPNDAALFASPNPCTIESGKDVCTSTISWTAPEGVVTQVWVDTPSSAPELFSCQMLPQPLSKDAPWITTAGDTFYLYQTSSCDPSAIEGLTPKASVTVTGAGEH